MGVVDEAVQDRIAECGVADDLVPVVEGELARHERGAPSVAVLEHFQEISSLRVRERGEPEVVEDELNRPGFFGELVS